MARQINSMLVSLRDRIAALGEARVLRYFKLLDLDGSGHLDAREFRGVLAKLNLSCSSDQVRAREGGRGRPVAVVLLAVARVAQKHGLALARTRPPSSSGAGRDLGGHGRQPGRARGVRRVC